MKLTLRRKLGDAIAGGHPWVYREALESLPDCKAGDVADLVDVNGDFVARGTVDPASPLAFRVWTLDPAIQVDQHLVTQRLRNALALRQEVVEPNVTGYRVCHGENDYLPGMHCDRYGSFASLRLDSGLGKAWEPAYVAAVESVLQPDGVLVQNTREKSPRVVSGHVPEEVEITEGRCKFIVNLHHGQKTGFFLDQRENRQLVARLAPNRTILNLFSYTGGFSVAAALAGARRVVSVDIAAPAIEDARRNFKLNDLPVDSHGFEAEDAFDVVSACAETPGEYDLIVLDPPSFASSRKAKPRALRAYLALNTMALKALPSGGWLATASCSSHVHRRDFLGIVTDAAREAGRQVTIAAIRGAGPDHPVRPGFPEGDYLNFVLARVA